MKSVFVLAGSFKVKLGIEEGVIKKLKDNKRITENEIVELVKQKESDILEFKQNINRIKEITITLSSFANHNGGLVIVGVNDRKQNINERITGANIGYQSIENLVNAITERTEPKLYPVIKVVKALGKDLVLTYIDKSENKPVSSAGRFFKRVGNVTKQMSRNEFERLLLEKKEKDFDSKICEEATLNDIDEQAVNRFREIYEEINKTTIKGSNKELLKSLNCIKDVNRETKATNAGILLFGKKPENFFSMDYITIARYPGKEKAQTYSDIKDFHGNLFDIVDSANEYIKEHIQEISKVIEGKLAREVIPQYPYFAIRELITNAVVHRDYSIRGSRIIIRMFKDRIEFNSPGGLPANITPKNIVYEQYSRNPAIAEVFNRAKFIEKLGEGWDKIISVVKEHPFKPKLPHILDTGNTTIVTLYSPEEMVEEKTTETVNKWLTNVDARLTQELSGKEKGILLFMLKTEKINSTDCQKLLNISREMANRYFTRLIKRKLIVKKGAGKYTYYVIKVKKNG